MQRADAEAVAPVDLGGMWRTVITVQIARSQLLLYCVFVFNYSKQTNRKAPQIQLNCREPPSLLTLWLYEWMNDLYCHYTHNDIWYITQYEWGKKKREWNDTSQSELGSSKKMFCPWLLPTHSSYSHRQTQKPVFFCSIRLLNLTLLLLNLLQSCWHNKLSQILLFVDRILKRTVAWIKY